MGSILSSIGGGLVHLVLPSLATILASLAVSFVAKKASQAGVDLTQAQTDLLKTEVTHAVQAVEERATRAKAAGNPMTPDAKRKEALAIVAASPNIVQGNIQQMIDTVLPEVRAKLTPAQGRVPPQAAHMIGTRE